ncbi:MAG: hypothetical protein AAF658_17765, partial [Myxococcota bacterium]
MRFSSSWLRAAGLCGCVFSVVVGCERNADDEASAVLVPPDPGPPGEEGRRERAEDLAIPPEWREAFERGAKIENERADEELRERDLAAECLALCEEVIAEKHAPTALLSRADALLDAVARRFHLREDYFDDTHIRVLGLPDPLKARAIEKLETARAAVLERSARSYHGLLAIRDALARGDMGIARDYSIAERTRLESFVSSREILGSRLSYVRPLAAEGQPTRTSTVIPAYLVSGVAPRVDIARSTAEVDVDERVQAIADELGADPVALYERAKNSLSIEMRAGLNQGASSVWRQGRGSAAELAAATIALFRAAEIPAR